MTKLKKRLTEQSREVPISLYLYPTCIFAAASASLDCCAGRLHIPVSCAYPHHFVVTPCQIRLWPHMCHELLLVSNQNHPHVRSRTSYGYFGCIYPWPHFHTPKYDLGGRSHSIKGNLHKPCDFPMIFPLYIPISHDITTIPALLLLKSPLFETSIPIFLVFPLSSQDIPIHYPIFSIDLPVFSQDCPRILPLLQCYS